jgi:hypothetical protein
MVYTRRKRRILVYTGITRRVSDDGIEIMPIRNVLELLEQGGL